MRLELCERPRRSTTGLQASHSWVTRSPLVHCVAGINHCLHCSTHTTSMASLITITVEVTGLICDDLAAGDILSLRRSCKDFPPYYHNMKLG